MPSLFGAIISNDSTLLGRLPAAAFVGPDRTHIAVVADGRALLLSLGSIPGITAEADIGGIQEASLFFDGMLRKGDLPAGPPVHKKSSKETDLSFDEVRDLVERNSGAPHHKKAAFLKAYDAVKDFVPGKRPSMKTGSDGVGYADVNMSELAEREREACIRNSEESAERAAVEDRALAGDNAAVEEYLFAKGVKPGDIAEARDLFILEAKRKKTRTDGLEYEKAKKRAISGERGTGSEADTSELTMTIADKTFSLSGDVSTKAPDTSSKSDVPGPSNPSKEHHSAPGVKVKVWDF